MGQFHGEFKMSKTMTKEELIKDIKTYIKYYKDVCEDVYEHEKYTTYICWRSRSLLEKIIKYLEEDS